MSVLLGDDVIHFIDNLIDVNVQVQPAGVDLTVREILLFKEPGYLGFSERRLPECIQLKTNSEDYWILYPAGAYKVIFNEIIRVPEDCIGICKPRSSLIRMGATLITAIWDPGYVGRSEALLVVFNPYGIYLKRNARIGQLIFIKLTNKARKKYSGSYQYENI